MGCFLSRDGLPIILDKLLRMISSGSSRDAVCETPGMETFKKCFVTDGVHKVSDVNRMKAGKNVISLKKATYC